MKYNIRLFFIALQFLTRIPTPLKGNISQHEIAQSILYYPLVGVVIGMFFYAFNLLIMFISTDFPSDVLAALILMLWVFITGGLHLDGLADSADAWVGGLNDRDRTLEIMKDPYCGPMGVIVLVLILLVKWTTLSALLETNNAVFLIVIPMLSRSLILVLFMTTVYVRDSGLATAFIDEIPDEKIIWSVLLISSMTYLLLASFFSFILVIAALIALRAMMLNKIGGMTGDTLGASVEISEMIALLALLLSCYF